MQASATTARCSAQPSFSGRRLHPPPQSRFSHRPQLPQRWHPLKAKKDEDNDTITGIINTATGLVDKAADLVPESVPRPAARAGVGAAGILVVFWLLQKVISGVLTLVVIGGVGYYFLTKSDDGDDSGSSKKSKPASSSKEQDLDDPLAEAKRIMDKYK